MRITLFLATRYGSPIHVLHTNLAGRLNTGLGAAEPVHHTRVATRAGAGPGVPAHRPTNPRRGVLRTTMNGDRMAAASGSRAAQSR